MSNLSKDSADLGEARFYISILYFMCLFLEMLWVKKVCVCVCGGGGGNISVRLNIFSMLKICDCLFCSTAFVDKINRENIIAVG